ncbi:F-box protein PP2-A15-like isoform X1 [Durio zibethinus]|uniref:F-box protein PP2-A15-like isoform X1 n=1 Tax=Durio zibethinus TaxID=66656 RepID=A0A6P6AQX4_DURZI|nr:F-box protein PP2-A15-like isoform X1 [Durio zibethinus]
MGASLSNLTEGTNGTAMGPGLGDIPESCVACVFTYLTPPEICNLARLNRAFRGAASSDSVWEKKLPSNYQDLLELMPPERYKNLSKKDIFALLSHAIPFDDGNKEVWLDRVTGRVCMAISAKGMAITGIDDRRYWNWVSTEESRWIKLQICWNGTFGKLFHVVAYLQQIWWFEVDGVVKFPLPADVYTLSFRLHLGKFSKRLGRRVSSFEHTHGWHLKPVTFELSTSDGQLTSCEHYLDDTEQDYENGNHKRGCWIDYKVGEFIVGHSEPATEVRFSMKQIACTHSKGGLCVDSVFIIPTDIRERKRRGILK